MSGKRSVKLLRFRHGQREALGALEGDEAAVLEGDLFGERWPTGERLPLSAVQLLAPVRPSKIVAVALNYRDHLAGAEPPARPELFLKAPSAIIGPEEAIVLPQDAGRVDAEGELVAVIGRRCRHVPPERALEYVLGYTCGNDVSARDWQRGDLQWWRAKSADTFAPLGPCIVEGLRPEAPEGLDPTGLELTVRINGQVVQHGNTSALIHDVAKIVSFASAVMTLEPGDLIFTGTPGATQPLKGGDVVEVEIAGIGVLRNPVRDAGRNL